MAVRQVNANFSSTPFMIVTYNFVVIIKSNIYKHFLNKKQTIYALLYVFTRDKKKKKTIILKIQATDRVKILKKIPGNAEVSKQFPKDTFKPYIHINS